MSWYGFVEPLHIVLQVQQTWVHFSVDVNIMDVPVLYHEVNTVLEVIFSTPRWVICMQCICIIWITIRLIKCWTKAAYIYAMSIEVHWILDYRHVYYYCYWLSVYSCEVVRHIASTILRLKVVNISIVIRHVEATSGVAIRLRGDGDYW